jgi:hypothetical protein
MRRADIIPRRPSRHSIVRIEVIVELLVKLLGRCISRPEEPLRLPLAKTDAVAQLCNLRSDVSLPSVIPFRFLLLLLNGVANWLRWTWVLSRENCSSGFRDLHSLSQAGEVPESHPLSRKPCLDVIGDPVLGLRAKLYLKAFAVSVRVVGIQEIDRFPGLLRQHSRNFKRSFHHLGWSEREVIAFLTE